MDSLHQVGHLCLCLSGQAACYVCVPFWLGCQFPVLKARLWKAAEEHGAVLPPVEPTALLSSHFAPCFLLQFDGDMEARLKEAEAHGEVLRYVGSYDAESGVCQVGLGGGF